MFDSPLRVCVRVVSVILLSELEIPQLSASEPNCPSSHHVKAMRSAKVLILAVALAVAPAVLGQALQVSSKFPLEAHVTSVGMETQVDAKGNTSTRHLMKAEINGKRYSLASDRQTSSRGADWFHAGTYPCRLSKHGFEFEYIDDKGKVQHLELHILSEDHQR